MSDGYDTCFTACKPCEDCGQHIPKNRTPALCIKCAPAVPPRPAAPDRGAWVCERCGKAPEQHAAGGDAGGCVYAPAFVIHHPTAPDATAEDGLRDLQTAIAVTVVSETMSPTWQARDVADAVLALPALRDVLAAAARDAELRVTLRELHTSDQCWYCENKGAANCAVMRALDLS